VIALQTIPIVKTGVSSPAVSFWEEPDVEYVEDVWDIVITEFNDVS
jgi:hypothetical protein